MKKFIFMSIMMLVSIVGQSMEKVKRDPYHLILEGRFLSEKGVKYELYKVEGIDYSVKELSSSGNKYFSVQIDVGAKYVMKFTSKSGKVKYLNIEVQSPGYLAIDVDFSNDSSANLVYNKSKKNGYDLRKIQEDEIWYVQK